MTDLVRIEEEVMAEGPIVLVMITQGPMVDLVLIEEEVIAEGPIVLVMRQENMIEVDMEVMAEDLGALAIDGRLAGEWTTGGIDQEDRDQHKITPRNMEGSH
jgi:hypothetical protein